MNKPKRIVEIEWLDHGKEDSWLPIDEAKQVPLLRCYTVGYVIDEDDERIVIASTFSPRVNSNRILADDWVTGISVISKKLILSINELKKAPLH